MKNRIIYIIILICFVLFSIEVIAFNAFKYKQIQHIQSTDFKLNGYYKYSLQYNFATDFFQNKDLREPVNFGNNYKILLFGCSYAYGAQLEPEQTFYYKLAQKTGSVIYNRSIEGASNAYMLFQIDNNKTNLNLEAIDKDIDTIIYIYMEDQKNRLHRFYWVYFFCNIYNLQYKIVKDNNEKKLVEDKPLFPYIHIFYISKFIHNKIENILNSEKNTDKNIELLIDIFAESHKKLAEKYPKAKFILIEYNTDELDKFKEQIQESGWNLYSTFDILGNDTDLNDDKYHFRNDPHPNEAAWNIVVDNFVSKNIISE